MGYTNSMMRQNMFIAKNPKDLDSNPGLALDSSNSWQVPHNH